MIEVVKILNNDHCHECRLSSKFFEIDEPEIGTGLLKKTEDNLLVVFDREEKVGALTEFYGGDEYKFVDTDYIRYIKGKDSKTLEKRLIGTPVYFTKKDSDKKETIDFRVYVMNKDGKTTQVFK